MTRFLHRQRAVAMGLALLAAACSDSSAPELSDPDAIETELTQVQSTFESDIYTAFSGLSGFMAPPATAALLRATAPDQFGRREGPRSVASAQVLRNMASSPLTGPIIPDALYGTTYEWDPNTDQYVEAAVATGPANGVRFLLYAIDPLTDLPVEPTVEVGYADLMDESVSVNDVALHIVVAATGGTPTFLDYTVSVAGTSGSLTASSVGYVSNGAVSGTLRRLDFDVSFSAEETGPETGTVSADATLTFNNAGVSIELHDTVTFSASSITFDRDFRFHRPGEVVTFQGTLTFASSSITGQITVRINGRTFVQATFSGENVSTSRELTPREQAVLVRLLEASDDVWEALATFFNPAELFAT